MTSLKIYAESVEVIEAFLALEQLITCHFMLEADRLRAPVTDQHVINHTINHFNGLVPTPTNVSID